MKLNYIDALRGIAILSVIWFHCHLYRYSNPAYYSFMDVMGSPSALGVQLFYVLSAFTLFLSMSKGCSSPETSRRFAIRRFFRIAPLYYVAMLYYVWQKADSSGLPFSSVVDANTSAIVANGFFLHGLSPEWINAIVPGGWSVGIEVLVYALLPLLFSRIRTISQAVTFTSVTMVTGFLLTAVLTNFPQVQSSQLLQDYLFFYLPFQLPVFGCGIVAYFAVIRQERTLNPLALCSLAATLLLVGLSKTLGRSAFPNLPHTLHFIGGTGFVGLIIFLSKKGDKSNLLVNPLTRFLGKISYSAYLTHFGVLHWMDKIIPKEIVSVHSVASNILNFQLKFLLMVAITALISVFTYWFIEVPTQKLGSRFLKKADGKPTRQSEGERVPLPMQVEPVGATT